jgi:regulatory protein
MKRKTEIPDEDRSVPDREKALRRTFDRAVNLLTYKPRSISEIRKRLLEKDWTDASVVDEVIEKLKYYGYLDDDAFARSYAGAQLRERPLGKMALRMKLNRKNLDRETVDRAIGQILEETPEEEIIDRAIARRIRLKGRPETREDAKKFYDHLLRQGFSYDLVSAKMREVASREFDDDAA